MKEIKNEFIKEYIYGNDIDTYYIYILENNYGYGCYLQNKDYGVIMLMFGLSKEYTTLKKTEEIIKNNLEDQIKIYQQLYED